MDFDFGDGGNRDAKFRFVQDVYVTLHVPSFVDVMPSQTIRLNSGLIRCIDVRENCCTVPSIGICIDAVLVRLILHNSVTKIH